MSLERVRRLISEEGINQTKLSHKVHKELKIGTNRVLDLLKKRVGVFWTVEKGNKNATIYNPFFSN